MTDDNIQMYSYTIDYSLIANQKLNKYIHQENIMKHCILAPPKRTILYTNNEQILPIGQALLLRSIAAFIMVLLLYTLQTLPAYAQATVNVSYEAVNIPDPVEVGQEISYKIKWSCASSTSDCDTFDLNYTLPSGFDFVSMATPPGYSASETGGVVNINTPTLNGGDSAEATLVLRVGYSEAPDNNFPVQGTLAVTTDTGAALNETDPLDPITLDPPTTQWDVTKTKTQPAGSTEPAVDNPVGYRLQYCSASTTGNVDIANAVLVDTFPAGATVVDPDGGNVSGNTITWNIGTLNYYPPNNCVTKNILLQYPTPTFATGQSIDNHVDGTGAAGTSSDGPIGDDTQTNTLSAPLVEIDFNKSSETQIVGPNALAEFTFSVDNSQSNVTASNFVIEETVPPELKLTHIKTGQWRDAISVTARIEYQNRGSSTWNVLGTVDFNDDRTYTGADAGGSAFTTDVGKVRWVFFTASGAAGIPSGFETTTSPRIWAMPSTPIAADTNTVTNCAAANYTDPNGSSTLIEDSCGDVEITDTPITITDIDKRSNPTNNIVPGEPINYSIDLKLLAESSADWINPVVTDTLPAEMTFISWNNVASDFNNGVPANTLPTFTTSTLPSGATQLIWSWTGANAWTVEESELARTTKTHTIKYTAQVKEGVPPGGYDNVANYTSDSPNEDCNNGPCEDTHTANVRDVGIFQSDKWVAGDPFLNHVDFVANPANSHILYSPFDPSCPDDGTGLTRFPCIARSYPLETFPYKLEVRNAGNVELRDYVLYDVLPHAGDTGVSEVLQGDPRGSLWQPLLTGPVIPSSLPAPLTASDIVIEYSDAFNSCRPEVSGSSNENGWQTGCVNDWTTTPDNWDDVKSFKIYFKDSTVKWPPQTDMIFSITMLIPNTNVPSGSIAWNSVAHRATNDFSDSRLLTADPKKVGIAVLYYDWGDLPDLDADSTASPAYDTDIATQGGARHLILPELYLGAGVDAELDGQPNDGANGDDSNVGDHNFGTVPASGDDEDGIKFLNDVIMPGDPVGRSQRCR